MQGPLRVSGPGKSQQSHSGSQGHLEYPQAVSEAALYSDDVPASTQQGRLYRHMLILAAFHSLFERGRSASLTWPSMALGGAVVTVFMILATPAEVLYIPATCNSTFE